LTEATISQEEKITLSKELTETREQLKQKQQEIDDLKLITPVATFLPVVILFITPLLVLILFIMPLLL
jgi:hypothetical protein